MDKLAKTGRGWRGEFTASLFAVAALALCGTAFAGDTFYWVGGGGNWSDVSNWYRDSDGKTPATRCPGGVTNTVDGVEYRATDDVVLFASTATGTITLDVDATIWRFSVQASSKLTTMTFESADAADPRTLKMTTSTASSIGDDTSIRGKRTVTFRNIKVRCKSIDFRGGNGIFDSGADIAGTSNGQTTLYAWEENCIIRYLDGCTVKAVLHAQRVTGTHQIEGGTVTGSYAPVSNRNTLRILGGTCNFSSGVALTTNSTVEISGGTVSMSALTFKPNTTAIISGGDITLASMPVFDDSTAFIFTNGTLTVSATATTTDRRLLGTGDAVYRSLMSPNGTSSSSSYYTKRPSINVCTNDGDTVTFGTMFATNGNYGAYHTTNSVTLVGDTMNLSRFTIAASKAVYLDANRLNLGVRLFPTYNNSSLHILNGITFGAFGNWYVYDKTFTLYLNGDIAVDTTDCFDGVTPRTIGLWKVSARSSATISVGGNGVCDLVFSSVPYVIRRLDVMDGATLQIASNDTQIVADDLSLGAGATLRLRADKSGLDAANIRCDPTATVSMEVPAGLSRLAYPVTAAQDDDTAALLASRTVLTGDGAADWDVRSGAHSVYLAKGVEPTYGETGASNIWTGANSGCWNDAGNWTSGVVPYSASYLNTAHQTLDTFALFNGTRNMYITNDIAGTTYVGRMLFMAGCGPVCLRGGKIQVCCNGYRNTSSTPICSLSRFPVIIESEIVTSSALSIVAGQDSYISLDGTTTISGLFRPCGDIRVGGNLTSKGLLMEQVTTNGRRTKMQVLDGGTVTVTAQYTNQVKNVARYVVDAGGRLVFENGANAVHGSYVGMDPSYVNGLMDFQCPYFSSANQYFYGTGTVQVASVQSHTFGSSDIILGYGITLKPKSWTTVTADAPDNYIRISVTNDAVLSAAADWTYGPEAGVTPTTTAAERALAIAPGATLTVKTEGYNVSFADPIVGKGSLVVAEGSKVALAGDLLAAAKSGWTTFATVGSFACADGAFQYNYLVRTVDNGDGTVDVQARVRPGTTVTIR